MCIPVLNFGKSCIINPTPEQIKVARAGTQHAILWIKRRSFEILSSFGWKMSEADGIFSLKDNTGKKKIIKKNFLNFGYPFFPEPIVFPSWKEYEAKTQKINATFYRQFIASNE